MSRSTPGAAGDLTQHTTRLVVYALLAIFLMALDHRGHYLDRFHHTVRQVTEPMLMAIDAPIQWMGHLSAWSQSTQALLKESARLEEALRQQQASVLTSDALARENDELRALLGLEASVGQEFITARVLSVDLSPFSHRFVIDRGRGDGLSSGLPVVDQGGLIGQVDSVSAMTASVILITDPDHALPVRVARTGDVTLAYGGGLENDLTLPDLPMNIDLEPGDELVTSGLGGIFPPGLPVARVERINQPEGQSFAVATATPRGQHDRSRFVIVVRNKTDGRSSDEPLPEDVSEASSVAVTEEPNDG